MRLIDYFFVLCFATFFLVAIFMDSIPIVAYRETGSWRAPLNRYSLGHASFPPAQIRDALIWWCEEVDILYQKNPLWLSAMGVISPTFYAIFYLFAIYALIRGRSWIKTPGIMWASALGYSCIIIIIEGLFGQYPSPRPDLYLAAYAGYVIIPFLFLWRIIYLPIEQSRVKKPVQNAPNYKKHQ